MIKFEKLLKSGHDILELLIYDKKEVKIYDLKDIDLMEKDYLINKKNDLIQVPMLSNRFINIFKNK